MKISGSKERNSKMSWFHPPPRPFNYQKSPTLLGLKMPEANNFYLFINRFNHKSHLKFWTKSESTMPNFISITSPISSCVTNKGTQILLLLPKRLLWEMQPIFSGEYMFNHLYQYTIYVLHVHYCCFMHLFVSTSLNYGWSKARTASGMDGWLTLILPISATIEDIKKSY